MPPQNKRPDWTWQTAIHNGAFEHAGDAFDALAGLASDNLIPGWSHHGGGGDGRVQTEGGNYFLELTESGRSRTHNAFYLSSEAAILQFDLRVPSVSAGDALGVWVGDTEIANFTLYDSSSAFSTESVAIPAELRGQAQTLTFRLNSSSGFAVGSTVQIDNVKLQAGGKTGDIIPVDLAASVPGEAQFEIVGWDLVLASDGTSTIALDVAENALRGDHHLQYNGETIAFALFQDRLQSNAVGSDGAFVDSGRMYLAPPTSNLGSAFDTDSSAFGFQGQMQLWYRSGGSLGQVGPDAVAGVIAVLEGTGTDAQKLAALNAAFVTDVSGAAAPSVPTTSELQERIISTGQGNQRQWLIQDSDGQQAWALSETADGLVLFHASQLDIHVMPGAATINDAERVRSGAASPLEIAQMQQRLRYWNYPDFDAQPLVVDGIVGPRTRHAAGLFTASVNNQPFSEADFISGVAYNFVNSLNGPRWGEIVELPGDAFELVDGPFSGGSSARYFGTDWLIDTIRAGAIAAKSGAEPIAMPISVGALSAENGPGDVPYDHAGHEAGLSVDFVLQNYNAGTGLGVPVSGDGTLSVTEAEVVRLVQALEENAYPGATLREVRTSNDDIVNAINAGRLTPLASVDAGLPQVLHVEIIGPEPSFFPPLADPVVGEDANQGLQDVFDWLDQLIGLELDKQLPALVSSDAASSAASLAQSLGMGSILTGSNSLMSDLQALLSGGSTPTPEVLGEQVSRSQTELFVTLPSTASPPTGSPFDPADSSSFNYTTAVEVFDASGAPHDATLYWIRNSVPNEWTVRYVVGGELQTTATTLAFDPVDGDLIQPSGGLETIEGFQPDEETEVIGLVFDFSSSSQQDEAFTEGWTTWAVSATGQFERSSGLAGMRFVLNGVGSTGERAFDFSEAFSELSASLSSDIEAVAEMQGRLDFAVTWDTESSLPLSDTMAVQLHEFGADFDVLVDTILVDAKIGLLGGSIIDTGTLADPGTNNSFIQASAGFTSDLNSGEPVTVGQLQTLSAGDDYSVDVVCDLGGVLYFETMLAGIPIPGNFSLLLGFEDDQPTVTPSLDLDGVLDQLGVLAPKALADTAEQLAGWLSGLENIGPFLDKLPLSNSNFGKWADVGEELKLLLFDKFHEVQLVAVSPPAGNGPFNDVTTFELTISDSLTVPVTIASDVTQDNSSLEDLANDLSAAIANALDDTEFAGSVVATVSGEQLALRSTKTGITGLRVQDVEESTLPGLSRLGFTDGQAVEQLRFQTLQDLEEMINEALGLPPGGFALHYDEENGVISAAIDFSRESLLGSEQLALNSDLGDLVNLRSGSSIDVWRRVEGNFEFGIDLTPLGQGFSISESTALDTLPTWGMGIESGKSAHLEITLSDDTSFLVDLSSAVTIGDVVTAIEAASEVASTPRVVASINGESNGLRIEDLTFDSEVELDGRLTIAAAEGSFAPIILGILGEDDNDSGVIRGRALHGETLGDRFYFEAFTASLRVQATADDIDALGDFGFVEVGVENGSGEASAELSLAFNDPNNDGRIYFSEMMDAGASEIIGNPTLDCDLSLELPIVLQSTIAGLSLPSTAAVIVSWADIHTGSEPEIYLRDMDSIDGFAGLSDFGMSRELLIRRAIDGPLDLVDSDVEMSLSLRDGSSYEIELGVVDPSVTGPGVTPVTTFGELFDAIRLQTEGKVTVNFSAERTRLGPAR